MSGGVDSSVAARAPGTAGPRGRRRHHEALGRRPGLGLLLGLRCRRRPPCGRSARYRPSRVQLRRRLRSTRRRPLRHGPRCRADAQPVHRVQPAPEVRQVVATRRGPRLRPASRPATTPASSPLRQGLASGVAPMLPRISPTCCTCSTPGQLARVELPLGSMTKGRRPPARGRPRPADRRQARQSGRLFHHGDRRRTPPIPGRSSAAHAGACRRRRRRRDGRGRRGRARDHRATQGSRGLRRGRTPLCGGGRRGRSDGHHRAPRRPVLRGESHRVARMGRRTRIRACAGPDQRPRCHRRRQGRRRRWSGRRRMDRTASQGGAGSGAWCSTWTTSWWAAPLRPDQRRAQATAMRRRRASSRTSPGRDTDTRTAVSSTVSGVGARPARSGQGHGPIDLDLEGEAQRPHGEVGGAGVGERRAEVRHGAALEEHRVRHRQMVVYHHTCRDEHQPTSCQRMQ